MFILRRLLDRIIFKKRHLIFEEQDMIRIMKVIDYRRDWTWMFSSMCVGNCGWDDDRQKWFVYFTATNLRWYYIKKELNVIRVWRNIDIPKNTYGKVYSTD